MKQFISTLALLTLVSSPAFAQKKKTTVRTTSPSTSAPAASSAPVYSYNGGSSNSSGSGPHFSGAASFGSIDGTFVFGPIFTLDFPTVLDGNDFSFGARTGIYFGSTNGASFWAIPIMATGKYHFRASGMIKPYVGLGMGIDLTHASVAGFSDTSVHFSLLALPGISFGEGEKFFGELPIGTMSSGFAILPTFGYHFN